MIVDRRRARARVLKACGFGASALALACMSHAALAQVNDNGRTKTDQPAETSGAPSKPRVKASSAGSAGGSSTAGSGLGSTSAGAAPAPAGASSGGNEIIVTGIRQSLANAQSIKRNSDTVVDAITAEDIGALPDRSVNEAIQRVPGVAISRFAAPNDSQHFSVEGSGVVIRGLSYVRGEFNGRDTFAVNGGREIGFNDVPTELVGSVEVFKNLTPDMIEGGISGTVNINTRKPFDSKGQVIYVSGGMNVGDMARRGAPSAVGLYSNQWELGNGGRIGFLAGATYSQQYSRSDSVFLASMLPRYNDDANGNGVQDPGEGRVINAGTPYQTTLFDTFPVPAGFDHVYAPVGAGSRTQDFNRKRIGFTGALQYQNADGNLLVTAQVLRADSREDWIEHTIEPNVWYGDVTNTFPAPGTSYTFDDNGIFTSGDIVHTGGVPWGNMPSGCVIPNNGNPYTSTYCPYNQFVAGGIFTTFSNRHFYTKSVTQDQSLNVKWDPTERLHFNFDGQYVFSKSRNLDDIVDTATYADVDIDMRGKVPQIQLVTPGFDVNDYFRNKNAIYFRDAFNNIAINDGQEWAFRADGQYDVSDDGFFRSVRFGARYADRKQTVRSDNYVNWGSVSDVWSPNGATTFADMPDGDASLYHFSDFFRGQAITPPDAWFIPESILSNHDKLMDLLRLATSKAGGAYTPLEDRGSNLIDGYFLPNEIYRNAEKTLAGYIRMDFGSDFGNGMSLTGNVGVRYVHTEDKSFGAITFPTSSQVFTPQPPNYSTIPEYCAYVAAHPSNTGTVPVICTISAAQQQAVLAFSNGASVPDVATQKYDNFLPALNLKLQITPRFLMRFAASRAISRPNFGNLQDYVGLSVSGANTAGNFGFQASAQNPYLKPIKATQLDLTAEWYFAKVGSLTGALFYKDLTDIIIDNAGFTRSFTNNGQTFDVTVNGPANAKGHGTIKGFEIAYQQTYSFLPGLLRGLGAQATFTYVDASDIPNGVPANAASDGSRPPEDVTGLYSHLPLAGLSRYNFNVTGFYDLGGFDARLAYSWRSRFLLTNRDCCFPYLPVYSLASGQLDGSVFYTVNKHFKIGVEAQNLLDTTTKTVFLLNAKGQTAPRSYFKSDRQYSLTVRMTF